METAWYLNDTEIIFALKMSSHNVFSVILFMAVVKYEKPDLQVEWRSINCKV